MELAQPKILYFVKRDDKDDRMTNIAHYFRKKVFQKVLRTIQKYRGSLPFIIANFTTAYFITAIFQNFPKICVLCIFRAIDFITAISWPKEGKMVLLN